MKKLPLILALAFMLHTAHAQLAYKMKADSIYITNDSRPAELNIENSTKNVNGFLYNKGNGRTEFRKAVKLSDSTLLFGADTLLLRGTGYAFTNGITSTSGTIKLGGTIIANTDIQTDVYKVRFKGNGTPLAAESYGGPAISGTGGVGIGVGGTGVYGETFEGSGTGVYGYATSGYGVRGTSSGGSGVYATTNVGEGLFALAMGPAGSPVFAQKNVADNNTVLNVLDLARNTTGTAANNIGQSIRFWTQTSSGTVDTSALIKVQWTNATANAQTSKMVFSTTNNTITRDNLEINGAGQLKLNSYGSNAFTGTPTASLQTTATGDVIEGPVFTTTTYTPVATGVTNIEGATVYVNSVMRIGNTVHVSGRITIDPVSGSGSDSEIGMSLPFASDFAHVYECSGTATNFDYAMPCAISADITNNRATFKFMSLTSNPVDFDFIFQYRIL